MKRFSLAIVAALALQGPVLAQATQGAPAPAASAAALSTAATPIGTLIDNAAAKAVVDRHVPGLLDHPQIGQARGMTLRAIQQYVPPLTDAKLAEIDADLARLPATAPPPSN